MLLSQNQEPLQQTVAASPMEQVGVDLSIQELKLFGCG